MPTILRTVAVAAAVMVVVWVLGIKPWNEHREAALQEEIQKVQYNAEAVRKLAEFGKKLEVGQFSDAPGHWYICLHGAKSVEMREKDGFIAFDP